MNNELKYIRQEDYLIPNLSLGQQPEGALGKYGKMRRDYLKEYRPILYNQLLLEEELYPHLIKMEALAQQRLEQIIPQLAEAAGVTEEMKNSEPIKWEEQMNIFREQAEEIILVELICS